jgi:hypothetical protein
LRAHRVDGFSKPRRRFCRPFLDPVPFFISHLGKLKQLGIPSAPVLSPPRLARHVPSMFWSRDRPRVSERHGCVSREGLVRHVSQYESEDGAAMPKVEQLVAKSK